MINQKYPRIEQTHQSKSRKNTIISGKPDNEIRKDYNFKWRSVKSTLDRVGLLRIGTMLVQSMASDWKSGSFPLSEKKYKQKNFVLEVINNDNKWKNMRKFSEYTFTWNGKLDKFTGNRRRKVFGFRRKDGERRGVRRESFHGYYWSFSDFYWLYVCVWACNENEARKFFNILLGCRL